MTPPSVANSVSRGTASQSAHPPHASVSSMRVSPTSNTTATTDASVVAVVFDVGETLIDETEAWGGWADWLAVPRLTLFATLGGVIARGGHHSDALRMVRPGINVDAETQARDAAGRGFRMTADDLYPDALPCLRALAA